MKIWVLYFSYNQYDQAGDYVIGLFRRKPTKQRLKEFFKQDKLISCNEYAGMTFTEDSLQHLSKGLVVYEYSNGGGSSWYLEEEDVL